MVTNRFCSSDLNELAPTTFLSRSRAFAPVYRSTRRHLGESIRTADIIHVHSLWNPVNMVVRRECARHRRPYVLMPHGMLDPYSLTVRRCRKFPLSFGDRTQKHFG